MKVNNYHFKQITITNYRNYDFKKIDFKIGFNSIVGFNGIGKTNLLDAIYYTCFTRSYLSKSDMYNYKQGKDFFRIEAIVKDEKESSIVIKNSKKLGKQVEFNGVPYEKVIEHFGKFAVVFIAPGDRRLIDGYSDERRRFVDSIICQIDKTYFKNLIKYRAILKSRKAALELGVKRKDYDKALIDTYNEQLVLLGNQIFNTRKKIIDEIKGLVKDYYKLIADSKEAIGLNYKSDLLEKDFMSLLKESFKEDQYKCRTTKGIHKDDFEFTINDMLLRKTGSQGQQKSFILALKIAQYQLLKRYIHQQPILILDDIFAKLDEERLIRFLEAIKIEDPKQVFLSDTHQHRVEVLFEKLGINGNIINIEEKAM